MKNKPEHKIFDYTIYHFGIMMTIFSFFGWCAENTGKLVVTQFIDNRHQFLPFLIAYGWSVLALYALLGTPDKMRFCKKRILVEDTLKNKILRYVIYFLTVYVAIFVGEIIVGYTYELTTGAILWNYEDLPLHVTKYTSVITTIAYAGAIFILMKFVFTPLMNQIVKMPKKTAVILDWVFGVILMADFIFMVVYTAINGEGPDIWTLYFNLVFHW